MHGSGVGRAAGGVGFSLQSEAKAEWQGFVFYAVLGLAWLYCAVGLCRLAGAIRRRRLEVDSRLSRLLNRTTINAGGATAAAASGLPGRLALLVLIFVSCWGAALADRLLAAISPVVGPFSAARPLAGEPLPLPCALPRSLRLRECRSWRPSHKACSGSPTLSPSRRSASSRPSPSAPAAAWPTQAPGVPRHRRTLC